MVSGSEYRGSLSHPINTRPGLHLQDEGVLGATRFLYLPPPQNSIEEFASTGPNSGIEFGGGCLQGVSDLRCNGRCTSLSYDKPVFSVCSCESNLGEVGYRYAQFNLALTERPERDERVLVFHAVLLGVIIHFQWQGVNRPKFRIIRHTLEER